MVATIDPLDGSYGKRVGSTLLPVAELALRLSVHSFIE